MGVGFAIAHAITRSIALKGWFNQKLKYRFSVTWVNGYSIFIWVNYPFKKGLKEYYWFKVIEQHLLIQGFWI